MKVRKAIIPAAGLGTRLLPATKSVPKEMLPIVNKPAIQWIVEECVAAGIELVVLINGRYKGALEDHFDVSYEVEDILQLAGKVDLLDRITPLSQMIDIVSIRQTRPLGLGHAVLCGRRLIGDDEPFAVLLPDDIVDCGDDANATAQLVEVYDERGQGVVGLKEVPAGETDRYGIVAGESVGPGLIRCDTMIEKPPLGQEPSNFAIVGRYVLPPSTFSYLAKTKPGSGGEIQLTDAMVAVMEDEGMYGHVLRGRRYDTGEVAGLIEANIAFALKNPRLRPRLMAFIESLVTDA